MGFEVLIPILIILLFITIGIFLSKGKGIFLIAGFNTMSKEEREQYNLLNVCKFMSKFCFAIAFYILLLIINTYHEIKGMSVLVPFLIIGTTLFSVIYLNVSKKFKK